MKRDEKRTEEMVTRVVDRMTRKAQLRAKDGINPMASGYTDFPYSQQPFHS